MYLKKENLSTRTGRLKQSGFNIKASKTLPVYNVVTCRSPSLLMRLSAGSNTFVAFLWNVFNMSLPLREICTQLPDWAKDKWCTGGWQLSVSISMALIVRRKKLRRNVELSSTGSFSEPTLLKRDFTWCSLVLQTSTIIISPCRVSNPI